jgi:hypothetical protein
VITFDDGFRSVLRARPILDEVGFPATVFAVTSFAESGEPLRWPGLEHTEATDLRPLRWSDLELLREAAAVAKVGTAFSIGTLDEDAWRRTEPGTPHPRKRIEAVARINDAGVACGVLIAPVLPGITDAPRMLRDVVAAAIDAGATHVTPILLHLRPGVKEEFMPWLEREYPELVGDYRRMYRGSNAPKAVREAIGRQVQAAKRRYVRPQDAPPRDAPPRNSGSPQRDTPDPSSPEEVTGRQLPLARPPNASAADPPTQLSLLD